MGGNKKIFIETLLLRSIITDHEGNLQAAEKYLIAALEAGKTSGFVQVFRDEYKDLEKIICGLTAGEKEGSTISVDQVLLKYIDHVRVDNKPSSPSTGKESGLGWKTRDMKSDLSHHGLVEALSSRELEILSLMASGFSNRDIAEKLYISAGTVKWHTSNIYGKLGARNRAAAVGLAQRLNLIKPG